MHLAVGGINSHGNLSATVSVEVINSTIVNNDGSFGANSISFSHVSSYSTEVTSSIIAENGPGSSGVLITTNGVLISNGYNIFSDYPSGSITSDQLNVSQQDLNLLPLGFYGGFTQTMPPNSGSVAINMGAPTDISDAQNAPIVGVRDVGPSEADCYTPVINNTVTITGITLMSDLSNVSYQWLNCDNGYAPISGETNQDCTPQMNGNYALLMYNENCPDTSACYNINGVGIVNQNEINVLLYPNPNHGTFMLIVDELMGKNYELRIIDFSGKEVYASQSYSKTNEFKLDLPKGMYVVHVTSKDRRQSVPFGIQ